MTGLFRTRQPFLQTNSWQNQALNALHYNTSQQGSVVPIIYGTTRQQVNLINFANYIGPSGKKGKSGSLPVSGTSQTGKGGGGGKGKGSKKTGGDYSIDVDFAICYGPVTFNGGNNVFSSTGVEPFFSSGLNFYNGTDGQAPDPTFESFGFPVGYSGTVHITGTPMDLGQSPVIPNLSFEITGFLSGTNTGSYPFDANPANIITDALTNGRYGVGFPATNLDHLIGGSGTAYGDYCQAAQLLVSVSLDGHQTMLEWLTPFSRMTNTAMVWNGSLLQFIPYGDLALASNSATWTPNLVPVYSVDDRHFLVKKSNRIGQGPRPGEEDPIRLTVTNAADVVNWQMIEYTDRTNFYNTTDIPVFDQSLIDQFGLRIGDTFQGRMFCNPTSAQISAQLQLQRSIYFRATPYKFTLGWQFGLLTPMDIILLTGRFGDNYLNDTPVRILSKEENENGDLDFEAEEIQVGQNAPAPSPTPPAIIPIAFDGGIGVDDLGVGTLTANLSTTVAGDLIVVYVVVLQTGLLNPLANPGSIVIKLSSPTLGRLAQRSITPLILPGSISTNPPNVGVVASYFGIAPGILSSETFTLEVEDITGVCFGAALMISAFKNWVGFDQNGAFPITNQDLSGSAHPVVSPNIANFHNNDALLACSVAWNAQPPFGTPNSPWGISAGGQIIQVFDGVNVWCQTVYTITNAPNFGVSTLYSANHTMLFNSVDAIRGE